MCGAMQGNGRWISTDCSLPQPSICYRSNSLLGLIPLPNSYYITEVRLSWSEARSRCRSFYTDLAILSGIWENSNAQRLLTPDVPAWIGLSRNTWSWTNLNPSRFRNWLREETSDPGHDCALINPSALYRWEEENCSTTLPFLCYSDDDQTTAEVTGRKQILSLELQSDQDINDPAVKEGILQKIQQELQDQGMEGNVTLTWRLKPDGNVFQKKKSRAQDEL
ncbi:macrophage mannose receptor 1-like [Astyanax mexicanus]|nr:macrophage mannose receptor 1-like [Astyanax mexicanus]